MPSLTTCLKRFIHLFPMEPIMPTAVSVRSPAPAAGAVSRNPTTGELVATYAFQTSDEVERLLIENAAAFRLWRATPMEERVGIYRRLSATLRERAEALAALITTEMGKTIGAARLEVE